MVYVDNNLVHSNDVDEHIKQCKKVVRCLTKAGLKINLDKTKLCYKHILFMGSMIDGKQRGIDRHKIDVLNEMERPKTGKAMESFLGFVNFLRDYVPNGLL